MNQTTFNKQVKIQQLLLTRELRIRKARTSFWEYCNLTNPKFYKPNRKYLKLFCDKLQEFYFNPDKKILVINMPPRHGKTFTLQKFSEWLFGLDRYLQIMTASYNEDISGQFAKKVRDTIGTAADETKERVSVLYPDIFPNTKLKFGSSSAHKWSLAGFEGINYLATSPNGSATGFGATLIIVDDLIKNAEEARNENRLEQQWQWFTDTMLSRLEEGGKIVVCATRWASNDLAGRVIAEFKECEVITMKAVQDDESMLCEEVLSRESYEMKAKLMGADIVSANYQQEPIDILGRLYQELKEYTEAPFNTVRKMRVDTADKGKDNLCAIIYDEDRTTRECYIKDVLYTKEPQETTEKQLAKMVTSWGVEQSTFESNNGGRAVKRNVERICREMGNYKSQFRDIPQTSNKEARIISNAATVQNMIHFPVGWQRKYPEFSKEVINYQRDGKNKHDDGVDVLTAIVEDIAKPKAKALKVLGV